MNNGIGPPKIRAFIQARMSSARFPGKVLAPFRGSPIISHVIARVSEVVPADQVVVLTSVDRSDDPLACYVRDQGFALFRGSLENVFERFQHCAIAFPCDWILRISGDSPLLNVEVLRKILQQADPSEHDLVTNIFPRTFPKGESAELIRTRVLLSVHPRHLTATEKEHVTPHFYNHPHRFRILNVDSGNARSSTVNHAVDTVDDLRRLSHLAPARAFPHADDPVRASSGEIRGAVPMAAGEKDPCAPEGLRPC